MDFRHSLQRVSLSSVFPVISDEDQYEYIPLKYRGFSTPIVVGSE